MSKVPIYTVQQYIVVRDTIKHVLAHMYPDIRMFLSSNDCSFFELVYKDRSMRIKLKDNWMRFVHREYGTPNVGLVEASIRRWVHILDRDKPAKRYKPAVLLGCDSLRLEDFV